MNDDSAILVCKAIIENAYDDLNAGIRAGERAIDRGAFNSCDIQAISIGTDAARFFKSEWFKKVSMGLDEYIIKHFDIMEKIESIKAIEGGFRSWQEKQL